MEILGLLLLLLIPVLFLSLFKYFVEFLDLLAEAIYELSNPGKEK